MSNTGWYGVDLDKTLAEYDDVWRGVSYIGAPIPAMVARVQRWLSEGKDVRIFTARVCTNTECGDLEVHSARLAIESWCVEHIGCVLPITNVKDFAMVELYDDRCKQVEPNTGRLVEEMGPPCPFCGEEAIATIKQGDTVVGIGCFACGKVLWQPKPDQKHYHGYAVRVGHQEPRESCPVCAGIADNAKP